MKTLKMLTENAKATISGLTLALASVLLLSGCQKEELAQSPSTAGDQQSNRSHIMPSVPPVLLYNSIQIDHYSANSNLPDYSVIVNAKGTATFQGRRNISSPGTFNMEVSIKALTVINQLYLTFKNTDVTKSLDDKMEKVPAIPIVLTTISANDGSGIKTYHDYNNGMQPKLERFRKNVEKVLNIGRFVNGKSTL